MSNIWFSMIIYIYIYIITSILVIIWGKFKIEKLNDVFTLFLRALSLMIIEKGYCSIRLLQSTLRKFDVLKSFIRVI